MKFRICIFTKKKPYFVNMKYICLITIATSIYLVSCSTQEAKEKNEDQLLNEMESVDSMLLRDKQRLDSMQRTIGLTH